ncbi:hypothetical protein OC844_006999, partial [Tilletia horrida]
ATSPTLSSASGAAGAGNPISLASTVRSTYTADAFRGVPHSGAGGARSPSTRLLPPAPCSQHAPAPTRPSTRPLPGTSTRARPSTRGRSAPGARSPAPARARTGLATQLRAPQPAERIDFLDSASPDSPAARPSWSPKSIRGPRASTSSSTTGPFAPTSSSHLDILQESKLETSAIERKRERDDVLMTTSTPSPSRPRRIGRIILGPEENIFSVKLDDLLHQVRLHGRPPVPAHAKKRLTSLSASAQALDGSVSLVLTKLVDAEVRISDGTCDGNVHTGHR